MAGFRVLDEAALAGLDDGALIDYVLEARARGDEAQAARALKLFAFGMEDALRAFVRVQLPDQGDPVVDEVSERALEDAIRSIPKLRGHTPEEARAYVFKIARLRVVDFLRRNRPAPASLDDEGREGHLREERALGVEPETDGVETRLLEQALAGLRSDHRYAVELFLISGYSARETAEKVCSRFEGQSNDSMSEQNVNQIVSRFRKDLRVRLGEKGGG